MKNNRENFYSKVAMKKCLNSRLNDKLEEKENFLMEFARIVDRLEEERTRESNASFMKILFSFGIIGGGLLISFGAYRLVGLMGHNFLGDLLACMFFPLFILIAREVWIE